MFAWALLAAFADTATGNVEMELEKLVLPSLRVVAEQEPGQAQGQEPRLSFRQGDPSLFGQLSDWRSMFFHSTDPGVQTNLRVAEVPAEWKKV